jgi:hypothetical protein
MEFAVAVGWRMSTCERVRGMAVHDGVCESKREAWHGVKVLTAVAVT